MNKVKVTCCVMAIVLGVSGLTLLYIGDGIYDAVGVLLALWGNNVSNALKTIKADGL